MFLEVPFENKLGEKKRCLGWALQVYAFFLNPQIVAKKFFDLQSK